MDEIAIIYNASGTFLGEAKYFFGKICGLSHCGACDITHSVAELGEKKRFAQLRKTFPVPISIYHNNDIPQHLKHLATKLPVVIHTSKGKSGILFRAEQLDAMKKSVDTFQNQLETALKLKQEVEFM